MLFIFPFACKRRYIVRKYARPYSRRSRFFIIIFGASMETIIHITESSEAALQECRSKMNQGILVAEEKRKNHTARYPRHNRYFSNGDKPWVILVNTKNIMKFTYNEKQYFIHENELVFFDDNVFHSWEMNNNDMTIYYYRAKSDVPVREGTYCLDDYF